MKRLAFLLLIFCGVCSYSQSNNSFSEYLSYFTDPQEDKIVNLTSESMEVLLEPFLTEFVLCGFQYDSSKEYYRSGYKREYDNYVAVFVNHLVEKKTSKGEAYYQKQLLLITYSKSGQLIDKKVIAHYGRHFGFSYQGTFSPFNLVITQGKMNLSPDSEPAKYPIPCKVEETEYTISKDGKIQSKHLRSGSGKFVWNSQESSSELVSEEASK